MILTSLIHTHGSPKKHLHTPKHTPEKSVVKWSVNRIHRSGFWDSLFCSSKTDKPIGIIAFCSSKTEYRIGYVKHSWKSIFPNFWHRVCQKFQNFAEYCRNTSRDQVEQGVYSRESSVSENSQVATSCKWNQRVLESPLSTV